MSERIGYIGLGTMGAGMARNLLAKGHPVTVWNRSPQRIAALVEAGATAAAGPADLAARCDLVMVCVSDTKDVEQVVRGPGGVLEGVRAGSLIIDHSTISPRVTRALAEAAAAQGAHWLDAPVSGGSEGAARGTLSIMVGGEAGQVERARPYLEAYGTAITHVGPTGAGQMAKLVNQILVVVTQQGVGEALLLAQAGGLDLDRTIDAVKGGAAGSWMLANRGPQMARRDWRPGFTIDLQQKDLRLVLEAADELGVPLPGTALVFQLYRALQQRGLGAEGNHALVKALEEASGITLGGGGPGVSLPEPAVLRDAQPEDAAAMAALNVRAWRTAFAGLVPQALLDGQRTEPRVRYWEEHLPSRLPERTWVAERGGRVIGLAHLGPSRDPDAPEAAELYGMYVEPETVGTGIGKVLMTAAMDWFRPGPWSEAILWTLPGDHRAARFYRSWGWAPDGSAKTGHTPLGDLDEVRYRIALRV